jgi:hypothetical protein
LSEITFDRPFEQRAFHFPIPPSPRFVSHFAGAWSGPESGRV